MKTNKDERSVDYSFTIMGLIIAVVFITMTAGTLGYFFAGMTTAFNITTNNTFDKFNLTSDITKYGTDLNTTAFDNPLDPNSNLFDIVGSYFSMGWKSVKTAVNSLLFAQGLISRAGEEFSYIKIVTTLFTILIGIIVFILLLQALLKWYI